ncbi:MAG: hypothetical protein QNJ55_08855 [Xenococcus sp. MO_188.B8]|nr:hypothetical protein [Xenococcus sp. MO_188.B8]
MNLDYHDQNRPFEDFWISENNYSIGSFLIHGGRKGCHKWLINQLLIQNFPDDTTTSKKLIITVERETSIDELWKKCLKFY